MRVSVGHVEMMSRGYLAVICFFLCSEICSGRLLALGHRGRKFLLVIPGNRDRIELHITGPVDNEVHINCPECQNDTYFIDSTGLLIVDQFPDSKALSLYVTTSGDVSVHVITGEKSTEGYIVFPLDALSTEYMLASFTPTQGETTQWLVAAVENDTHVIVNYNQSHCTSNKVAGSHSKSLNKFELIYGDCTGDITGTFIRSTKPIAVFTRRRRCVSGYCGNYFIMLPPVMHFGNQYVLHIPDLPLFKTSYKMIAASNNTTLTQNNGNEVHLCSGCFAIFEVQNPLFISSDKPVMVLALSQIKNNISPRSLSILTPVENFMTSYNVHMEDGKINMVVLSIRNDVTGSVVSQYNVTPIKIDGCNFSVATLYLTKPITTVSLSSPFGAFLYTLGDWMLGYPTGFDFGPDIDARESSRTHEAETSSWSTFDFLQPSPAVVIDGINQLTKSSYSDISLTETSEAETDTFGTELMSSKNDDRKTNTVLFSNNELDDSYASTSIDMANPKPISTLTRAQYSLGLKSRSSSGSTGISDISQFLDTATQADSLIPSSESRIHDFTSDKTNAHLNNIKSSSNGLACSTGDICQDASSGIDKFRSGYLDDFLSSSSTTIMDIDRAKSSLTSDNAKSNVFINTKFSTAADSVSICTELCMPVAMDITEEHLLAVRKEIKEKLVVDRKLLTAQVQKKKSTPDNRPSSTRMGIVGIVCLLMPVLLAVFSDAMNILNKLKRVRYKKSKVRSNVPVNWTRGDTGQKVKGDKANKKEIVLPR